MLYTAILEWKFKRYIINCYIATCYEISYLSNIKFIGLSASPMELAVVVIPGRALQLRMVQLKLSNIKYFSGFPSCSH